MSPVHPATNHRHHTTHTKHVPCQGSQRNYAEMLGYVASKIGPNVAYVHDRVCLRHTHIAEHVQQYLASYRAVTQSLRHMRWDLSSWG